MQRNAIDAGYDAADAIDETLAERGWLLIRADVHNGRSTIVARCKHGHEDRYREAELSDGKAQCWACETASIFLRARLRRSAAGWMTRNPYLGRNLSEIECECKYCETAQTFKLTHYLGKSALRCSRCPMKYSIGRAQVDPRSLMERCREHAKKNHWRRVRMKWRGLDLLLMMECQVGHTHSMIAEEFLAGHSRCDSCSKLHSTYAVRGTVYLADGLERLLRRVGWTVVSPDKLLPKTTLECACPHGHTQSIVKVQTNKFGPICTMCRKEVFEKRLELYGWRLDGLAEFDGHPTIKATCENGHRAEFDQEYLKKDCVSCYGCRPKNRLEVMIEALNAKGQRYEHMYYNSRATSIKYRCEEGHENVGPSGAVSNSGGVCATCAGKRRLKRAQGLAAKKAWHCVTDTPINATDETVTLQCQCGAVRGVLYKDLANRLKYCDCRKQSSIRARIARIARQRGGRCCSRVPIHNVTESVDLECGNGHRWSAVASNVISGSWCKQCGFDKRRRSVDDLREFAGLNNGECLSEDDASARDLVSWRCEYGHEFRRRRTDFKGCIKFCPKCKTGPAIVGPRANLKEDMLARCRASASERGGECLSNTYINFHSRLRWKCEKDHEWDAMPSNVVHKGSWCPQCSREERSGKPNRHHRQEAVGMNPAQK